jgi:hypothetical protein
MVLLAGVRSLWVAYIHIVHFLSHKDVGTFIKTLQCLGDTDQDN